MSEFPSGKLQRGKILARTGLTIGKNYARYYARRPRDANPESE